MRHDDTFSGVTFNSLDDTQVVKEYLDKYEEEIGRSLGVSSKCAINIFYLRSRSWNSESFEQYVIGCDRVGTEVKIII
jgi:hypothetical protein